MGKSENLQAAESEALHLSNGCDDKSGVLLLYSLAAGWSCGLVVVVVVLRLRWINAGARQWIGSVRSAAAAGCFEITARKRRIVCACVRRIENE